MNFPILSKKQIKNLSKLLQKKHRQQKREFLAEGVRLCKELLSSHQKIKQFIMTKKFLSSEKSSVFIKTAQEKNIPIYQIDEKDIKSLSDTQTPQGILSCVEMFSFPLRREFSEPCRFLVLMDISDPGNVGTLIRTAQAFGWDRVIAIGNTAEIYNPKVIRSSMGAIFHCDIVCTPLEETLSFFEDTCVSYAVSIPRGGACPPFQKLPPRLALFLGNEANGLPKELIDNAPLSLTLPMAENFESLNVAMAGAILLFLLQK